MPSFWAELYQLLLYFLFFFQHGVLGELLGFLLLDKRGGCLFSNCRSNISGDGQLDVVL